MVNASALPQGIAVPSVPALRHIDKRFIPAELWFAIAPAERIEMTPGQQIAEGTRLSLAGQPIYAPVTAVVMRLETDKVVLKPLQTQVEAPLTTPTFAPLAERDKDAIISRVRAAGITGMGGAGFPAWRKLAALPHGPMPLLLINAVECEPGCGADAVLLEFEPDAVAHGMDVLADALQATQVVLACKRSALDAATTVTRLSSGQRARTVVMDDRYPAGDERVLCKQLGHSLTLKQRPVERGVIVFNVATVAAIGAAVCRGMVPTFRRITVHGPGVATPSVVEVMLGTPAAEVLAALGVSDYSAGVAVGGAMMSQPLNLREAAIGQSTTALYVPARHAQRARAACINCGRCDPVCPQALAVARLYELIEAARPLEAVAALDVQGCTGCGCCDAICPSGIPLAATLRDARTAVLEQRASAVSAAIAKARSDSHVQRERQREAQRVSRLRQRGDSHGRTKDKVDAMLRAARQRRNAANDGSSHDA